MKLPDLTLSANANSRWFPPNPLLVNPASLGIALTFSFNANLTASVQYTYDDPMQDPRAMTYARAGTVLTVTDPGHNLNVGDNIQISQDTNFNGGWDVVTVVDANTYTVTVPNAGPANGNAQLQSFRVFKHATMGNIGGAPPQRIDGNFNWQIGAYRLQVTNYVAGSATLTGQQGKGY